MLYGIGRVGESVVSLLGARRLAGMVPQTSLRTEEFLLPLVAQSWWAVLGFVVIQMSEGVSRCIAADSEQPASDPGSACCASSSARGE